MLRRVAAPSNGTAFMYVPAAARQRVLYVAGNRSYISTPLIVTRVVAILGLCSHRDLIAGRGQVERLVRQILGGVSFRSMQSVYNKFLYDRDCSKCQSRPHFLAYRMPACWPKPPPTCCDASVLMLVLAIPKAEVWPSIGPHLDDLCCMNKEHAQILLGPTASYRSSRNLALTRSFGVLLLSYSPNSL